MVKVTPQAFAWLAALGLVSAGPCGYPEDDCCMENSWGDIGGILGRGFFRRKSVPIKSDADKIFPDRPEDEVIFNLEFKSRQDQIIFHRPGWTDPKTGRFYGGEKFAFNTNCEADEARHSMQCIKIPSNHPTDSVTNPRFIDTIEIHPGNWCNDQGQMWNNGFRFDNLWARYDGHFRNLQAHPACVVYDDHSPKTYPQDATLVGKMGMYCEFRNADVGVPPAVVRRITEEMAREAGVWLFPDTNHGAECPDTGCLTEDIGSSS